MHGSRVANPGCVCSSREVVARSESGWMRAVTRVAEETPAVALAGWLAAMRPHTVSLQQIS